MSANEEPNDETAAAPTEDETRQHTGQTPGGGHPVPLFLRDLSDGRKGNEQDEKDEIGE
ncbi:MAG TPA: hypothetical protein VD861_13195 [Pyrinomonadaceae bacterium]|nr:hypothetical protein [Pyrinomonadaceae bacterium]